MRRLAKRSEGLIERLMPRASVKTGELRPVYKASGTVTRKDYGESGRSTSSVAAESGATASAAFDTAFDAAVRAVVTAAANIDTHLEAQAGAEGHGSAATAATGGSTAVEISKLLTESCDMLQVLAGSGVRIEVESRLPQGVELAISEEALVRVLVNLTVNARDAMPQGGRLRMTAQWKLPADSGGCSTTSAVLISVQDTGAGMPPEMVVKFNRPGLNSKGLNSIGRARREMDQHTAKSSDSGRTRGLGLEIVRELIHAAGGDLKVLSAKTDDELLFGTRFELALPLTGASAQWNQECSATDARPLHALDVATTSPHGQTGKYRATMSATRSKLRPVLPSSVTLRRERRGVQAAVGKGITGTAHSGPAIC
jgi:hypothetical protein